MKIFGTTNDRFQKLDSRRKAKLYEDNKALNSKSLKLFSLKSFEKLYLLTYQIQAFLSSDQRILFALSRPTGGLGDFELQIAKIEFGLNSFSNFHF